MRDNRKKKDSRWDALRKQTFIIWHKLHLPTIFGILIFYVLCCAAYWYVEYDGTKGAGFFDILLWNTATLFGQDYADHYPVSVAGRLVGITMLLIGMFGVSAVTGYISSALIEHRMNSRRGLRKLQNMKNHVLICGWKNDLKSLILDIVRKNRKLDLSDLVLINMMDEEKMENLLMDRELKGIQYIKGDYSEEQVLQKANAKYASKALILGQNLESLEPELVDSRVFVAVLMLKGMNPKIHICAEVQTKKYKNYLEAQKCDEIIYSEEYTRYILSTATGHNGMSRVLSALFDDGDGVSIQIRELSEEWIGKTFIEAFRHFKEREGIMVIGVLENMGAERALKRAILAEAQKSTNYDEIVQNLRGVKQMRRNTPVLNPSDDYIIGRNTGIIVLGEEV